MNKLYVVATPIGNLNDISKRALETLENVDLILCEDTRHSLKLLNHYKIKNKLVSYHKFNETKKTEEILQMLKEKDIALITDAGTPCISDPGYILIKEAKKNGVEVIGVGGISALITALSVSGLDSSSFTFYGFFKREKQEKEKIINEIKNSNIKTYIFYESPKRIVSTLNYIYENLGNVNISVSQELTKIHEKNYFGKIKDVIEELNLSESKDLGEYTFIIEKEETVKEEQHITIEALIIDEIIKNNISLKEAINNVNQKEKNISKKDIYNASLNIKEKLKKIIF